MLELHTAPVIYFRPGRPNSQLMAHTSKPSRGSLRKRLFVSFLLLCGLLLATPTSRGQTVTDITFTPSSPTAADVVTARIRIMAPICGFFPVTVVNGNTIRTTIGLRGCVLGPPGTFPATVITQFGPVPAGSYTYEVYFQYETFPPEFSSQTTLVVADAPPPPIPALDFSALAALALILSALGFLLLRRQ